VPLALALALAGCVGCGSKDKGGASSSAVANITAEPPPRQPPAPNPPPGIASLVAKALPQIGMIPGAVASFDYFEKRHAFTILPSLQTQVGPVVRATNIVVFHDHVAADLRDPQPNAVVRRYVLRNGGFAGTPERVSSKEPQKDIDAATFDASEVPWTALEAMVQATPAQACPSGAATHVRIARPLPFSSALTIRVFCQIADKNGWVDFDVKGTMQKTSRGA